MRDVLHHCDLTTERLSWFVEMARLDRFMLALVGRRLTAADEAELAARLHQLERALAGEVERGLDPVAVSVAADEHVRRLEGFSCLIHRTLGPHQRAVAWRRRTLELPC